VSYRSVAHWMRKGGGFARFSLVPLGQEDDLDAVNDPANFLKIVCHTGSCGGRAQGLDGPVRRDFEAP
jgi:hypothetical protein